MHMYAKRGVFLICMRVCTFSNVVNSGVLVESLNLNQCSKTEFETWVEKLSLLELVGRKVQMLQFIGDVCNVRG